MQNVVYNVPSNDEIRVLFPGWVDVAELDAREIKLKEWFLELPSILK